MNKAVIYFFTFLIMIVPSISWADKDPTRCMRNLQLNFFHEKVVYTAFSFYPYRIQQGVWSQIFQELKESSKQIPTIMKEKTRMMVPNPLDYPINPAAASQILLETLYEIYQTAMHNNTIFEEDVIKNTFGYIFSQERPKFESCFGKENIKDLGL